VEALQRSSRLQTYLLLEEVAGKPARDWTTWVQDVDRGGVVAQVVEQYL
jgi:hypothetical protein